MSHLHEEIHHRQVPSLVTRTQRPPPKDGPGKTNENGRVLKLSREKISRLFKLARKYNSVLRHANQGYTTQLEKVLRMTYGRLGPRKYELLAKFLYPNAAWVSGDDPKLLLDGKGDDLGRLTMSLRMAMSSKSSSGDDGLEELLEDDDSENKTEGDTLYPSLLPTITTSKGGATEVSIDKSEKDETAKSPTIGKSQSNPPPTNTDTNTTFFSTFYKGASNLKSPNPPVEETPPKWKLDLPPRLSALLHSQSLEQPHFTRVGASPRVKLKFFPPTHTIWGKPLPVSRYKNQRIKWYNHNITAAMPPLENEMEYWEVHNLVTGKSEFPAFIPRRKPARVPPENMLQDLLESQSRLILEGPQPGPRLKDFRMGRPHEITPRLLQRMLSRVVLSQTPLVKTATPGAKTEADSGLVFYWDDGMSGDQMGRTEESMLQPPPERQAELLFA